MAKRSAPGIQAKSETLTVRMTPKTKFGLDLLARKQKRNLSNVIEWMVDAVLRSEPTHPLITNIPLPDGHEQPKDMYSLMNFFLWDTEEMMQLVRMGLYCPGLLTFEEETVWKIIFSYSALWNIWDEDGNPKYYKDLNTFNKYTLALRWPILEKLLTNQLDAFEIQSELTKDTPCIEEFIFFDEERKKQQMFEEAVKKPLKRKRTKKEEQETSHGA